MTEVQIIAALIALVVLAGLFIIYNGKRKAQVLEPEALRAATVASYHAYSASVTRLQLVAAQAKADADAAAAQLAAFQKTFNVVAPAA